MGKPPGAKLIPYLIPPEDIVPGTATWYASLCTQCGAGCGVLVKVMEGRAKKMEGNPSHPVNRGRLCARGQAALQSLYNPDRITSPLKRTGERGSGEYSKISWEEAISTVADKLGEIAGAGETDKVYLLTSTIRGHLNALMAEFLSAYGGAKHIQYELFGHANLRFANSVSMGLTDIPHYDIEKTKFLLSFGADFSSTWLSPVLLSRGYGEMRQGGKGARGRLVQVEPRMSLTGANADEWVPARPGTEAILALAMAREIVDAGYYKGGRESGWDALLSGIRLKEAASKTGISAERIKRLAREFAETRPSLAIGGDVVSSYTDGVSALVAINVLNHIAGNIGEEGGVLPNPDPIFKGGGTGAQERITGLIDQAAATNVRALLHYNTNAVFTTPAHMKAEEALKNIPFIASFSSFMDETTALADVILPAHAPLEDWGDDTPDPGVGFKVATVMQPVVSPLHDTKGLGDIFIELAKVMGGGIRERIPNLKFSDYIQDAWKELYTNNREMTSSALNFDSFWHKLLAEGGWWPKEPVVRKASVPVSPRNVQKYLSWNPSTFSGDSSKYPFYLLIYPQAGFSDGRGANLPWLQELPDPITSVVWGSWVEINPDTARKLRISEGDMVSVESPYGRIEAPAFFYPGIRPDTVGVPVGQGHRLYGRYAEKRGANPIEILPYRRDSRTGVVALNSTRVNLTRTGDGDMVKMDVSTRELGRGIVQTVSPEEFKRMKKEVG
jgi:anaerobic selenocysteine-containing dehydrogenase